MATVHRRDGFAHPSGICGAGWKDGLDDEGRKVVATEVDERVDCSGCLSSMSGGRTAVRHGKVTMLFDPAKLTGDVEMRLRSGDGSATHVSVPLMHVMGACMKLMQEVGTVAAALISGTEKHSDGGA